MRKITVVLVFVLIATLIVGGCSPQEEEAGGEDGQVFKIGIVQIAEHPALDAARDGFIEGLAAEGFVEGTNVEYEIKSAQGEQAVALTIAQGFVSEGVDMILAIATPAAQAAATATSDIPILITAVTDPVAAELVESMEQPNTNVTGTTDMNPIKEQLELIQQIVPGVENIGVLYNPGEVNSVVQVDIVKSLAPELNLNIIESTATNTGEVSSAAESLVGRVEAFYVPTDNTVVDAISAVIRVAEDHKIPVIAGESESVRSGALATVGITYYDLGVQTGQMAAEVLRGTDPATMAIQSSREYLYTFNLTAAANMGVELPQELLDGAEIVE